MIYENMQKAKFISRPNRFIANIEVDGRQEVCHVKNTGRCRELLIPGAEVYVQYFENTARKTSYDLIAVQKGNRLINMDSQAPNKVVLEAIQQGMLFQTIRSIKPECNYHNSRFDFFIETESEKIFMEVKGVTLEEEGVVLFPDAPTERGIKHLRELMDCMEEGYRAYVLFVVQMKDVLYFTPNRKTHPAFGETLQEAAERGVTILAYDCRVTQNSLELADRVEVQL